MSHNLTTFDTVPYGEFMDFKANAAQVHRHTGIRIKADRTRRNGYKSTKELLVVGALAIGLVLLVMSR